MEYKKLLKHGTALLICVIIIMSTFQIQGVSAIFDPVIPIEDYETDWEEEPAIYWNPKSDIATNSNASRPSDIATDSNANRHVDKATNSNTVTIMATNSNSRLASGSNATDGLTPDTAIENLNVAIRQAEKLSGKLKVEMSDIVIYAMNPMYILPEASYTVNGIGVTIVPWGERGYDEEYIFIVEGGQLTLDNIKMRPYSVVAEPEESSLVYMSSGVMQLGEQVESYGTFVLDYTQPMSTQEPVIELNSNFDFATHYRLDLRFPEGMEQEVTVINSLSPDKIPTDVFKTAFPVVDIEDEWELFVEEQATRVCRDTVNADNAISNTSKLTQKSLVARREAYNLFGMFSDPTDEKNHVFTLSKTVVGTQEDKEQYFQFWIQNMGAAPLGFYMAYVLDSSGKVITSEDNIRNSEYVHYNDSLYYDIINRCNFILFTQYPNRPINDPVYLKDGQKLVFTNLPIGSRYSVLEERIKEKYKATVKVVENGVEWDERNQNLQYDRIDTGEILIGVKKNNAAFTNTNIYNSSFVTVTVSKRVEGDYANRTKQFLFKIFLRDSNGTALAKGTQLSYLGSVIDDSGIKLPDDGTLTLDQEGSATFELQHGQQIIITDVPQGQVRFIETEENPEYKTSYCVGNSPLKPGSDTNWVKLTTHKTFEYTNTRIDVVPSGIMVNKEIGMFLLILSMLILVGMISTVHIYNRRKRR